MNPCETQAQARAAEARRENAILAEVAAAAGGADIDWPAEIKRADEAIAREKLARRPSAFAEARRRKELGRLRSLYDLPPA